MLVLAFYEPKLVMKMLGGEGGIRERSISYCFIDINTCDYTFYAPYLAPRFIGTILAKGHESTAFIGTRPPYEVTERKGSVTSRF